MLTFQKWMILSCAITSVSCASAQYRYEAPLPVPAVGETNFQSFSKKEKLSINALLLEVDSQRNAIACDQQKPVGAIVIDIKPLTRKTPSSPLIRSSGYCKISFNVTRTGKTRDIHIKTCTHESFAQPTIKAVSDWTYQPRNINGIDVDKCDVSAKISFITRDKEGRKLPIPTGF